MPDKSPEKIAAMFDEIAPTYDLLNHSFTLGLDRSWRRMIVKEIRERNFRSKRILDLATGTGDLAIELASLKPEKLLAADISKEMLEYQRKYKSHPDIELLLADASELPLPDTSVDIVTIGFGLRNFEDISKCLGEILRVLSNDGLLIVLEMFRGSGLKSSLFDIYFNRIMPAIGNRVSGSKNAYSYLSESVNRFYTPDEFAELCSSAGFSSVYRKNNFLGIVNTFCLRKCNNSKG